MEAIIFPKKSCCFTGHRSEKLPPRDHPLRAKLLMGLEKVILKAYQEGYTDFYCGLCEGFDLLAAEIVLNLREKYSSIRLIGVLPYPTFGEEKTHIERALQTEIREKCNDIVSVTREYWRGCFQQRNEYMVDHSSLVIAAYFGGPGGTWNTLKYASRKKKTIWNVCASISPKTPELSGAKPQEFLYPEWLASAEKGKESPESDSFSLNPFHPV